MGSGQSKAQQVTTTGSLQGPPNSQKPGCPIDSPSTTANLSSTSVSTTTVDTAASDTPPSKETGATESKCPMHNADGSYSYDWLAMFRPSFPHGPNGKKPMTEEEVKAKIARRSTALDAGLASPGSLCPVQHREYNVYSQPINPTNNMPLNPNQLSAPDQTTALPTDRVNSTIPKGGAGDGVTWTYPSPQMFFNALARKGKLGDTKEDEISSVVALHNNMNEKTWKKVLEWEEATTSFSEPKLLKFLGRPKDLSPKAWLKHKLLGYPLPFDRHDWTILRTDGTTVRYVIDYYFDETRANQETGGMPKMDDMTATPSLLVDVRPALDGPSQLLDRAVRMPYAKWSSLTRYEYLPMWPTREMKDQVQESMDVWKSIQARGAGGESNDERRELSDKEAQVLRKEIAQAASDCRAIQVKVDHCQSDDECKKASLDLTICMGKVLCPLQHSTFAKALTETDEDKIEHTLERLGECVVLKSSQHDSLQRK